LLRPKATNVGVTFGEGGMNSSALVDGPTQLKIVLSALLLSSLLVSAIGNASEVCARSASHDVSLIKSTSPAAAAVLAEHVIR
jgi:hypothetical protein